MELLLYVLLFAGVIVLNRLLQQAARRRQEEEQARARAASPPAQDEPLEDIWGRIPTPAAPPPAARPPVPARVLTEAARRPHPVRSLLGDKRGLRRAVILMTVLGPCRAKE